MDDQPRQDRVYPYVRLFTCRYIQHPAVIADLCALSRRSQLVYVQEWRCTNRRGLPRERCCDVCIMQYRVDDQPRQD